ncbi:hypothetical protein [Streptomyces sp. NPDC001985]|uniref:hypothetical protein n=1 Tax=Streptomyces sp. NPDC001985 TaxID=3154406 RepID=UPI0033181093
MHTPETPPPPYTPDLGEVAKDTSLKKVGRVMGQVGGRYQLRPLAGGREWDVRPEHLAPAARSDVLSAWVAEINSRSRRGL